MNALDVGLVAVLIACAIYGYKRGLVRTAYKLVSYFIALFLTVALYPHVSRFLRESFVYDSIRERIGRSAGFRPAPEVYTPAIDDATRGNNLINALPLPQSLRDSLHNYNTPDMFEVLRVGTAEEFVSGFFANMVINALSMLLVFVIVIVILRFVGRALGIVDHLPVIRSLNRLGGFVAGACIGAIVVWFTLMVVTMFFSAGGNETLYGLLQGSGIVRWLFGAGWLLPRMTAT